MLQRAQRAAVEAVRPGVTAEQVDAAARDVLAAEGLAEVFVHRTGHGIGLSVHEEPYIVAGNDLPLEEGMAFSVEPGIYFPGQWGARIEDIVIVTADGAMPVNNRPHELVVVPAGPSRRLPAQSSARSSSSDEPSTRSTRTSITTRRGLTRGVR